MPAGLLFCYGGSMTLIIKPEDKDLGEFTVRRVLPAAEKRAVGPFVFFDHFGPAQIRLYPVTDAPRRRTSPSK